MTIKNFDYTTTLITQNDGIILRNISSADEVFAAIAAQSLLSLIGRKPSIESNEPSTRLQGNLCEFCVWDLGEQHWGIYNKINSVTANARSPWRDSSKSGIDILAATKDGKTIYVIEVKSSQDGGSGAIFTDESSLKTDFEHLFERKAVEERIWGSVNELVADFNLRGNKIAAENIKNGVGDKPDKCIGVKLLSVVICKKGETLRSHGARTSAFSQLNEWLQTQGWKPDQLEYRTIEILDFKNWLNSFINKVIS